MDVHDLGGVGLEDWWWGNLGKSYVDEPLRLEETGKIFVLLVNAYLKVSSAKKALNNQGE